MRPNLETKVGSLTAWRLLDFTAVIKGVIFSADSWVALTSMPPSINISRTLFIPALMNKCRIGNLILLFSAIELSLISSDNGFPLESAENEETRPISSVIPNQAGTGTQVSNDLLSLTSSKRKSIMSVQEDSTSPAFSVAGFQPSHTNAARTNGSFLSDPGIRLSCPRFFILIVTGLKIWPFVSFNPCFENLILNLLLLFNLLQSFNYSRSSHECSCTRRTFAVVIF